MLLDARQSQPPPHRHAGAAAARHGRPGRGRVPLPDPAQGGQGAGRARSPSRSSIRRAWDTRSRVCRAEIGTAPVFEKLAFSCWRDAAIKGHLIRHHEQGRPLVIVAGIEAHVCVLQSCIDSGHCRVRRLRGGRCHVVAETGVGGAGHHPHGAGRGLGGQHRNGGLRTARPGRNGRVQGALGTCSLNAGPTDVLTN